MTIKSPNKTDVEVILISFQVYCNKYREIHRNTICLLTKSFAYSK